MYYIFWIAKSIYSVHQDSKKVVQKNSKRQKKKHHAAHLKTELHALKKIGISIRT